MVGETNFAHRLRWARRPALPRVGRLSFPRRGDMILRLEAFGRCLHLEYAKLEQAEQDAPPDNAPQPMVIAADYPADPIGFRLGWVEEDKR